MKTIAWIFVGMAGAFLVMILYFVAIFFMNASFGLETKILAAVIGVLALGTIIGRLAYVFKDTLKKE